MVKEELIMVMSRPDGIFKNGDLEGEFTKYVYDWEFLTPGSAIRREPQYIAFCVTGTNSVRVIAEVDLKKSKLDEGRIRTKGDPIRVDIPIRFGKKPIQRFRYTTFKRLLTHGTSDEL